MDYEIPREMLASKHSVIGLELHGETIYVKKRRPAKNPLGHAAQSVLHRLTGIRLLLPPPGSDGDSVASEASLLRRYAEAGIRVPRVLHQAKDYFIMSDVGPSLGAVLTDDPGQCERLIPKALGSLRHFHDLGFAHGGALIKNITILNDEIHFIDFDDAIPPRRLDDFQFRDVFLFFMSLENMGLAGDIRKWCDIYDQPSPPGPVKTFTRLRQELRSMKVPSRLFSRFEASIPMRDVRTLIRLVNRLEKA